PASAVIGRHDDGEFHDELPVFASLRIASASAGSILPSYSARPEIAPASLLASGLVMRLTSSSEANPPDAITGIDTASANAIVASQLMPESTPSRSISV